MNIVRLGILGMALGSAAVAAYLAKGFVNQEPTQQQAIVEVKEIEVEQVLVITKDLNLGDRLDPSRVRWQEWPKNLVTPNMITKKARPTAVEDLEGARARALLVDGEPVLDRKIVKAGDTGFLAAILPKGMRAVAVEVSVRTGAGGFILPNDRVDILLTRKVGSDDARQSTTETLLSNVRILAIDQTFKVDEKGEKVADDKIKTATLELEPKQAEVLTLMEATGSLALVLRSLADAGDSELGDDKPVLAERFTKTGERSDQITYFRYGKVQPVARNQ